MTTTTAAALPDASASIDEIFAATEAWLAEHWDPDLTVEAWWQMLADERMVLPSLPTTAYGLGYDRDQEKAVFRAIAASGALGPPRGVATMMAAPTIAAHGSPEQIERFVPPILNGQHAWCQLFSEPGAGSDLAGLTTKATLDGDTWTVNGQKVWTSIGQTADMGMLLARTDFDAPKHRGISWFSFDMRQDGVDIRPLKEMTGHEMFNEVFLDNTSVADDALIGAPGEGWRVGNTTLGYERMSLSGAVVSMPHAMTGQIAGELPKRAGDFHAEQDGRNAGPAFGTELARWLIEVAAERGKTDDPVIRDQLADLFMMCEINRLYGLRIRSGGARTGGEGNIGKLMMSELYRRFRTVGSSVLGIDAILVDDDATNDGRIAELIMRSPAPSIYGGTDQVQRNILGERVLGLPREPGPGKDTPFRELPSN